MTRRTGSTRGRAAWLTLAPAAVVLLAGLVATGVAFTILAERERTVARLELERRADAVAATIEHGFVVPLQAVFGVSSQLRARDLAVGHDEFAKFTAGALAREPAIYALEWAPVVADAERAEVEAAARADGQPDWEIRDKAPGGAWIRAATRAWYVPILHAAPPNAALGFDLASLPDRKEHILRARDGAHAIVSDRLQLIEDPPGMWAIAVYEPVWRGGVAPPGREARATALAGFAICVFRMKPVIERVLPASELGGLDVVLTDPAGPSGDQVLWESRPDVAVRALTAPGRRAIELPFVDRTWRVTVVSRDDTPSPLARSRLVLVGGALVSVLAAALLIGVRVTRRLERVGEIGRQLGQYTLVEPIGAGGMGVVYAARHALLRRPTAVKLLLPDATDDASLERFEREVRLTAELTHPNVVAVYDYGHTPDGVFYYAMELLDGITFEELLAVDGAQPTARTVHVILQLAGAIAEAHGKGLVHRDLKPANLMLVERGGDPDFVKVLDFGLVKRVDPGASDEDSVDLDAAASASGASVASDAALTRPGIMFGTPGFSPPEAMRGEPADVAGDVYSIGAVWYALLAGRPPFRGATARAVGMVQVTSMPPPPSKWRPERGDHVDAVPAAIDALILRCMDRRPERRPASAIALVEEIERLGIPTWTRADARLWWATHGAAVRAVVARRRVERAAGAVRRDTVAIDLARRT